MSFYLSDLQPKCTESSSITGATISTPSTVPTDSTTSAASTIYTPSTTSLSNYSASLAALQTSNEDLENKVSKLCSTTSGLNRDLLKLRRHVDSFHHECLSTWQADVLTRLIEVVYLKQRRKLPWGVVVGEHEAQGWDVVSRAYVTAANRISRKVLEQKLGLGAKYHEALKKYSEIVEFRSSNPYRSEKPFAQFLVSGKENNTNLYAFWAKLFPLCYGKAVEESSEVY